MNMKEIMFENKDEIIQASEDYLRPLSKNDNSNPSPDNHA